MECEIAEKYSCFQEHTRGGGGRNPSLMEVKAMLLMADIVNELSIDAFHSGSNQ